MPSPRALAGEALSRMPWDPERRRIAECCGVDAASVLGEREQRAAPTLQASPELRRILRLAADDAQRNAQVEVGMEHVFFGMLRAGGNVQLGICHGSALEFNRFRDAVLPRVRVTEPTVERAAPSLAPAAARVVHDALALARSRHDAEAHGVHLLAIAAYPGSVVDSWITRFGGSLERLRDVIDDWLRFDNAV